MWRPVSWLLEAYVLVLIAYVIFAWVPRPPDALQPVARAVRAMVDPILQPMRRRIPPLRIGGVGLDLSILLLFLIVNVLQLVAARMGV